jgi:hypothetical protein
MPSRFTDLMPHQMTATAVAIDRYGAATPSGSPRTYRCRVQPTTEAWDGADPSVSVRAKCYTDESDMQQYEIALAVGDVAELSDYWGGTTYTVIRIDHVVALDGTLDHAVVWLA